MFKDFFYFPRSDRRAILVLSALLLIGVFCLWESSRRQVQREEFVPADTTVVRALEDSLHTLRESRWTRVKDNPVERAGKGTTRSCRTLVDARGRTGGAWQEDWVRKFQSDTVLDLNTVDTILLQRVPGIGSWRARRIVEFRGHLGGYSRVEQLMEVEGMPDSVLRWFAVHSPVSKKINLNRATADEMAAHPYLTYKQARVILQHKRKHGPLHTLSQLSLYDEFPKEQLERLVPYVDF